MESVRIYFDFSSVQLLPLLLLSLLTWRISSLFTGEDGPLFVFKSIRDFTGLETLDDGTNIYHKGGVFKFFATLLACLWCLSIWVGWLIALIAYPSQWIVMGLILSTISIAFHAVIEALVRFKKWGTTNV